MWGGQVTFRTSVNLIKNAPDVSSGGRSVSAQKVASINGQTNNKSELRSLGALVRFRSSNCGKRELVLVLHKQGPENSPAKRMHKKHEHGQPRP